MGKTKNLIFYSHSQLELCYFCILSVGFICQKYYYITSNSSRGVHHACKFRLRTDVSRDTQCSSALNTQLSRVIAERAIHHVIVMDGHSFGQSQWNFLLTS